MGSEAPPVLFNVTGFRKFHGVAQNPTETLVCELPATLAEKGMPPRAFLQSCTTLETIAKGGLPNLLRLLDSAAPPAKQRLQEDGGDRSPASALAAKALAANALCPRAPALPPTPHPSVTGPPTPRHATTGSLSHPTTRTSPSSPPITRLPPLSHDPTTPLPTLTSNPPPQPAAAVIPPPSATSPAGGGPLGPSHGSCVGHALAGGTACSHCKCGAAHGDRHTAEAHLAVGSGRGGDGGVGAGGGGEGEERAGGGRGTGGVSRKEPAGEGEGAGGEVKEGTGEGGKAGEGGLSRAQNGSRSSHASASTSHASAIAKQLAGQGGTAPSPSSAQGAPGALSQGGAASSTLAGGGDRSGGRAGDGGVFEEGARVGGVKVLPPLPGSGAVRGSLNGGAMRTVPRGRVVWVHFGVNSGAASFAVERRAVNEATFRCPDEMGWQPQSEEICAEDGPVSFYRETKVPTSQVVQLLGAQGYDVEESIDAGRYVCNYVYYQSLRHAQAHGTDALFVHVPTFANVDEETQLAFVVALLQVLALVC